MNPPLFEHSELITLIEGLDDGTLDAKEREQLHDLLLSSAEARKVYHDYMGFVAALQSEARTQAEKDLLPVLPGANRRGVRKNFTRSILYAAAILVIMAVAARFIMAPEAVPYASVTPSADIIWNLSQGDAAKDTPPGVITPGSTVHVTHGSLNISLPDGTELILEGPAALHFPESLYQPELQKGRLWVDSNVGKESFSITTNGYLVKDIGTRFGVFAGDSLEVHVFEGEVQLVEPQSNEKQASLKANEAIRVVSKGKTSVIPLAAGPFPTQVKTAASMRFSQNFSGKNNLLDRGWVTRAGNWKQGKDGLTSTARVHAVMAHRSLPANDPFFVSMDFQFKKRSSGKTEQWAGVAWNVPVAGDQELPYFVFRVRQDSGRVTISRVEKHSDANPLQLMSSEDAGGDLGALKMNHDYRLTLTVDKGGVVTGKIFDLSAPGKALMTLSKELEAPERGNLGIYTRFGNHVLMKKFSAQTTRSEK
ncbi:MAG: FecR domain-containing protein [Akkermansiaceae bacterium]|nr:FecR domain-containing protein [Akkermansiaceae bacterium]